MKFSKVSSNMEHRMDYGMNALSNATKELNGIVEDFSQCPVATHATIQNLVHGFPELYAQMQQ